MPQEAALLVSAERGNACNELTVVLGCANVLNVLLSDGTCSFGKIVMLQPITVVPRDLCQVEAVGS